MWWHEYIERKSTLKGRSGSTNTINPSNNIPQPSVFSSQNIPDLNGSLTHFWRVNIVNGDTCFWKMWIYKMFCHKNRLYVSVVFKMTLFYSDDLAGVSQLPQQLTAGGKLFSWTLHTRGKSFSLRSQLEHVVNVPYWTATQRWDKWIPQR